MTRRLLTMAMTALIALLLLGGTAALADEIPEPSQLPDDIPLIEIPQPVHHAGTVARGESSTAVYTIRNSGSADLRLVRADGHCSCIRTTILRSLIPPGEEGGVEVVFTGRTAVGETTRVIELTSNDPQNRMSRLTFNADVTVPFGFEARALVLGKIHHRVLEPVSRRAALLFSNPGEAGLATLVSSSPLITVEEVGLTESRSGHQRLEIEVVVNPGLPPGPLHETITATAVSGGHPPATLPLTGMITGDVEATPEHIHLMVVETMKREASSDWKRIYFTGHDPDRPLKVFDCRDSNGLLGLGLVELVRGEKYELTVTLEADALPANSEITGTISVTTNSLSQPRVTVDYSAVYRIYQKLDQGEEDAPPAKGKTEKGDEPETGSPAGEDTTPKRADIEEAAESG